MAAERIADIIYGIYDRFTGTEFNATVVTTWWDGTAMDDSKVDNALYFKNIARLGGGYIKRNYDGNGIFLSWFGLLGNDANSVSATLNTLIPKVPENSRLIFESGKSYIFSSTVNVLNKNITLDFNYSTVVNTSGSYAILAQGLYLYPQNISSIVHADTDLSTVINVPDSTGYLRGDYVRIISEDLYPNFRSDVKQGEVGVVDDVGTGYISISGKLINTYTTTPRIAKYKDVRVNILNPIFDTDVKNQCIMLQDLVKPLIKAPVIKKGLSSGVLLVSTVYADIDNLNIDYLENSPDDGLYGYAINDLSGFGTRVHGGSGSYLRHYYTTNARAGSVAFRDYGEPMFAHIYDCESDGADESGFDTHEQGYMIRFSNCFSRNDKNAAFKTRSKYAIFENCRWDNAQYGMVVSNYANKRHAYGAVAISCSGYAIQNSIITNIIGSGDVLTTQDELLIIDGGQFECLTKASVLAQNGIVQIKGTPTFKCNNSANLVARTYGKIIDYGSIIKTTYDGINTSSPYTLSDNSNIESYNSQFFAFDDTKTATIVTATDVTGKNNNTVYIENVTMTGNINSGIGLDAGNITQLVIGGKSFITSLQYSWKHRNQNRGSYAINLTSSFVGLPLPLDNILDKIINVNTTLTQTFTSFPISNFKSGQEIVLISNSIAGIINLPTGTPNGVNLIHTQIINTNATYMFSSNVWKENSYADLFPSYSENTSAIVAPSKTDLDALSITQYRAGHIRSYTNVAVQMTYIRNNDGTWSEWYTPKQV